MKSFLGVLSLAVIMAGAFAACSDSDKPIAFEELPAAAQQLIKGHFADKQVTLSTMDKELFKKSYEVTFSDGTKLEFDGEGEWNEIDCQLEAIPIALIPAEIATYVQTTYTQANVTELSRNSKGYEAKLSNRLELKFNKDMALVEIDN